MRSHASTGPSPPPTHGGQGWKWQLLKFRNHLQMGSEALARFIGPSGKDFAFGPH